MQIDSHFSELLIYLLNKHKQVELDEIAQLHWNESAATLNEHSNSLSPPSIYITASRPTAGNISVLEILREENVTTPQNLEAISNLLQSYKSKWELDRRLELPKIGRLEQYLEEIKLISNDVQPFFNPAKFFPTIEITAVESQQNVEETNVLEEPFYRSSSKGRKITINSESVENVWTNYATPLLILLVGMFITILFFRYFTFSVPSKNAESRTQLLPERAIDDKDPFHISDSVVIFRNQLLNKYSNLLTQDIIDSGCKIVVGSFAEFKYAEKLYHSLRTDGYNTSLLTYDEGTRVIITFDCSKRDLVDYLMEIRIKISDKAWLIEPLYDPFKE